MKTIVIYGDGMHDDTEAMAAIANGTASGDLVRVSVCCEAPIGVDGGTTLFYRCTKCGMPCDAKGIYDRTYADRSWGLTINSITCECGKVLKIGEIMEHKCQPSAASAGSPQIPEILFDGYTVLKEVEARQNKLSPPMPTWEQVSIVLDAIVAIMKRQ